MIAYVTCFSFSMLFVALSEYALKRKRKLLYKFLGFVAVLILSVMAGIRSYKVGTDVDIYILPLFYRAQSYAASFHDLLNANVENVEILFLALEYIAVRFFRSPHFVMFALSFLTNGFIYMGIMKQREKMSVAFAWLTYCLIYYNVSLNLMRQSVSIAILFYLFSDLEKLTWKRVIFFSIFASLFHISGLIGIFFYAVYLNDLSRKQNWWIKEVFVFVIFTIARCTTICYKNDYWIGSAESTL